MAGCGRDAALVMQRRGAADDDERQAERFSDDDDVGRPGAPGPVCSGLWFLRARKRASLVHD